MELVLTRRLEGTQDVMTVYILLFKPHIIALLEEAEPLNYKRSKTCGSTPCITQLAYGLLQGEM